VTWADSVKAVLWIVSIGALLFLSAGTLDWPSPWIFMTEFVIGGLAVTLWLAWRDPGLLKERMGGPFQKGQAFWDKVFMAFIIVVWHSVRLHGAIDVLAGPCGRIAFADWPGARSNPSKHFDKLAQGRAISLGLESNRTDFNERTNPMITGRVKFYNGQKGFGFIQPDDGGNDVFVHATALERAGMRNLVEGQKVSFDTEVDNRSGKTAVGNIKAA
jgi:CspA family cold shock protein